ncbi:MAG TPA: hypothetical protein VHL34_24510, partial [Rhizomicrobium sp.]|nr:hypothetical protein [Rhizomicrobium sp.]
SGVDRNVRAQEHASDHAPVWIELSDSAKPRTVKTKTTAKKAAPSRAKAQKVKKTPAPRARR